MKQPNSLRAILLAVTSDDSWILMTGFPELLVRSGWTVHLVSSPGPRLEKYRSIPGILTHEIPMVRTPSPCSDLRSLVSWVRLLRRIKPQIVSAGTPKAGLIGMMAASMTGVDHRVYLLRGLRLETSTGPARVLYTCLERLAATCSTAVIAISPSLKEKSQNLRLANPGKIKVLGPGSSNGIELDQFAEDRFSAGQLAVLRNELGLNPEKPVLGFVGRLTPDKGLSVLEDASKKLKDIGVEYQLLFIGDQDPTVAKGATFLTNGFATKTVRVAHVQDVAPYYRLMDYLVFPTLREGFGNVIIEAQASGIPVITTDATGARDRIVPGINGVIVKKGDSQSLANGIYECLVSPRDRWNNEIIRQTVTGFSRDGVQSRYLEFYASLINGQSASHSEAEKA